MDAPSRDIEIGVAVDTSQVDSVTVDGKWVDIDVRDELAYSGAPQGEGMQCNTDDKERYDHINSICRTLRRQVLRLDRALDELKEDK